jgi:hypothetical protein
MALVKYELLRKIKKNPGSPRGIFIDVSSWDTRREAEDLRHTKQHNTFIQSEANAKELVSRMPQETKYTITRRNDESPTGEISFKVDIKNRNEKGVKFGIEGSDKTEFSNYLGFCLQTGLMVRNTEGQPVENKLLVDKLSQMYSELPQTRSSGSN